MLTSSIQCSVEHQRASRPVRSPETSSPQNRQVGTVARLCRWVRAMKCARTRAQGGAGIMCEVVTSQSFLRPSGDHTEPRVITRDNVRLSGQSEKSSDLCLRFCLLRAQWQIPAAMRRHLPRVAPLSVGSRPRIRPFTACIDDLVGTERGDPALLSGSF
jgi:hypothetical protein